MIPSHASLLVLAGWAAGFALFAGLGTLAAPVVLGRSAKRNTTHSFWLGFVVLLAALQLWNFALPVNPWALACLIPFALAGLVLLGRRARAASFSFDKLAALGWLLALFMVAWTSRLALLKAQNGDVCAYHLQAVRWASTYAVVPGLGNLNYLLGRNTAYPLYVALLEVGPLANRAQHLANGLLFLGVAVPALFRTMELFRPAPRRSSWLWAVALGLSFDELMSSNLSSPAADGAMWCLLALTALFTLEPILDREPMSEDRLRLALLTALCGVLIKPSGLLAGGIFSAFALAMFLRDRRRPPADRVPQLPKSKAQSPKSLRGLAGFTIAVTLLVVVPWAARGYVVSGYPLFPSTIGNLNLEWRIPESKAASDREDIDSYDKYQRADFVNHRPRGPWLATWLSHEWLDNRRFLFPVVGWALALLALGGTSLARRKIPPLAPALIPLLIFAALWLPLLPDTRFTGPLLWFGAAVTWLCLGELAEGVPVQGRRWLAIGAVLLLDAGAFVGAPGRLFELPTDFAPLPPESFTVETLPSGEQVHQSILCCMELPCAIDARRVRTREHGNFAKGFLAN